MQGIISWGTALIALIGYAIVFGIHPMLYGTTADLLARGGRVRSRLAWLLVGLVGGATGMFLLLHIVDPTRYLSAIERELKVKALDHMVDLYAGLIVLAAAAAVVIWKLAKPTMTSQEIKLPGAGVEAIGYALVGLSCAVVGFTTWPLMYLVMRTVSGLSDHTLVTAPAFIVFLLALIFPFVFLSWIWSRFPKFTTKVTNLYTRVLALDYRWILAAVLALCGVGLLALAFIRWDA